MSELAQWRRRTCIIVAFLLLAGTSAAPASGAVPEGDRVVTVEGTIFQAARRRFGSTTTQAPRVIGSRAAFARKAAMDHAARVKGTAALGTVTTQPTLGPRHVGPGIAGAAGASPSSATPETEAAVDLAPGLSATAESQYWGAEAMAASPGYIVQVGSGAIFAYPREDPPDEPTWSWPLDEFLGLPAAEAGYGATAAWDQRHGRWVVAAGSWEYDERSCNEGFIVLAVSAGENPAGSWTQWRIPLGGNSVDGLSLGISDSLIAIGGNEYPLDEDWVACLGLPFSGARVRALDWADVLDGGSITVRDLTPSQPRRSWAYRLARNTPVAGATDAGGDLSLLVDRYDEAEGTWGNVVYGAIAGSVVAGTASLETIDLSAGGAVPRLGGPPWLGASPGYRINGDWLGEGSGIDEAVQSIARRGSELIAAAAASCTPAGDASVRTCLRIITLDLGAGAPTLVDDALLAAAGADTYFGAVGHARDGTTFAMMNRGGSTVATWRAAGEPMSAPQAVASLDGDGRSRADHWPSQATLVPDPVDPGLAWSTLPTPVFGVRSPAMALRGGVSAPPQGTAAAPAWSRSTVRLRLDPSPASPITQVRVSDSPATYSWNGHEYLASPVAAGMSSRQISAGVGGSDGPRTLYVQWLTADNVPSPVATAQTTIDETGPILSGTRAYLVPQTLGSRVKVRWTLGGTDGDGIGIAGWQAWSDSDESDSVLHELTPAAPSFTLTTKLNLDYRVTAQGRDKLDNRSWDDLYLWARSRLVQNTSSRITYAGSWATRSAASASGGSVKVTTRKGTATIRTTGVAFAIVATKGPGRGRFSVSVDGGPAQLVDTRRSSTAYRQLVWQVSTWNGPHTIRIKALATSGRARIDLDAFLVMEDNWSG